MLREPARLPDDTQPNPALLPETPPPPAGRLNPGWMVVAFIITSITLIITLALLIGGLNRLPDVPALNLTLIDAGTSRPIRSSASTVGEMLAEQGIGLSAVDTVSYAPETPLISGMEIIIERARGVMVTDGSERQTVYTTFISPYDILRQAKITLNPADRIWIDGTETEAGNLLLWEVPPLDIVIRRAVTLTVLDNGVESTLTSAADTIGEALFAAGLTMYASDVITPDPGQPLTQDTQVVITRGQPVTIQVDGAPIETRVLGGTVGEALAQAGVAPVGLDYVLPAENEPVTPGMTIQVIRVTEDTQTQDEELPFETIYQPDANMELDTRAVVQNGQKGLRRYRMRVRYEDGQEIGREPDGDEIVQQPVNQIIAYGTQVVLRTVDTPDGPREYWRKLKVYATSYHPEALGGDDSTALGMKLEKGMIGADPKLIPWRTNLYVPEYGVGIMGDTGGPRKSRYWIDLGYSDADYTSWHWYTEVYLLTPVPEEIPYLLPEWAPPH